MATRPALARFAFFGNLRASLGRRFFCTPSQTFSEQVSGGRLSDVAKHCEIPKMVDVTVVYFFDSDFGFSHVCWEWNADSQVIFL